MNTKLNTPSKKEVELRELSTKFFNDFVLKAEELSGGKHTLDKDGRRDVMNLEISISQEQEFRDFIFNKVLDKKVFTALTGKGFLYSRKLAQKLADELYFNYGPKVIYQDLKMDTLKTDTVK